jgi:hypothetical protein
VRIIQVLCELTTQGGGGRRRPYIARGRGRGRGEAEKRGYGMVARLHVLVFLGGLADGGDVTRISFPELELRPAVRCGADPDLSCPCPRQVSEQPCAETIGYRYWHAEAPLPPSVAT